MVNMKSKEELKIILNDFIQYKDYFENPPEEAFVVDEWDYSKCEEVYEIVQLLYKYEIYDTKYDGKLKIMKQKYSKRLPVELSLEKLSFEEVLVILTWVHREERHCGGCYYKCIKNGTFYNLLCRMEEIKNEL